MADSPLPIALVLCESISAEGGLTFQATINGKGPFKTLFDTGAVNFMSESFAHRLGLEADTQGVEFGTSSPAKIQAHKIHVDTLQIGDLVVHDQTFYTASLPEDGGTPVLIVGYELLRRFAVKINHERQSLTFYDGPRFHYYGSGTAVPLEIQRNGNGLFVEASIGKASGRFILDTGNGFGFSLATAFTQKNDLVHALARTFLPITDVALVDLRPKHTWSVSTHFASAMFSLQVLSRTLRRTPQTNPNWRATLGRVFSESSPKSSTACAA
jgi:hypothetical protein